MVIESLHLTNWNVILNFINGSVFKVSFPKIGLKKVAKLT